MNDNKDYKINDIEQYYSDYNIKKIFSKSQKL